MENETGSAQKIIIGALIVAAIGAIIFGIYRSRSQFGAISVPPPLDVTAPKAEAGEIINAKHQYREGKHTYAGTLGLPTPCDLLQSDVIRDPLNPNKVGLAFKSVYEGAELCAQVITPRPFKVTFAAPEKIDLTVTYNGKPIRFNVFEVPKTENLDDFEINIKG